MRLALNLTSLNLTLTLGLAGCDGGPTPTPPPTPPTDAGTSPAAVKTAEPVLETAAARSKARWDAIVDADWIQAYDFQTPTLKELQSLSEYLRGKETHEYRNPSQPRLLGGEKDEAYVELSVLWTPHHPMIEQADNKEGDLTQQLDVVETWQWVAGQWYWSAIKRQDEFLKEHPNLGR